MSLKGKIKKVGKHIDKYLLLYGLLLAILSGSIAKHYSPSEPYIPQKETYYYYKITVHSLEDNSIIYNGWGRSADYYWFGTGVTFYDRHGIYREIAGNAIIGDEGEKMEELK